MKLNQQPHLSRVTDDRSHRQSCVGLIRSLIVCGWLLCPLAGPVAVGGAQDTQQPEEFKPLFDGKTLDGWEGNTKIFRVEEGAIVGGTLKERIPHNEFLCTKAQYGDFELRLEARLIGDGKNAGIQFRTRRIPDHHEVIGYQCDMGMMQGDPIWGCLYDESRRRKMLVNTDPEVIRRVLKPADWNRFRIRCQGPRVQIWLNDQLTTDYLEQDESIARSGVIGLQIHGGKPAEARYRKIMIREL